MKSTLTAIFSALTASVCCIGPLILIALGLGGLGIGAAIGKYHWYFIMTGGILLSLGWRSYLVEKKACEKNVCEMKNKTLTKSTLIFASVVVMSFTGLNLYSYQFGGEEKLTSTQGATITIPVKNMTCITCEAAVESALKKDPGIYEAKASTKNQNVMIAYNEKGISIEKIINIINDTGYKASRPED